MTGHPKEIHHGYHRSHQYRNLDRPGHSRSNGHSHCFLAVAEEEILGARLPPLKQFLQVVSRREGWSDMEWQIRNFHCFTWASGDHIVDQHIHHGLSSPFALRENTTRDA